MKNLQLLVLLFVNAYSYSQVGIGTTTPNSSAELDVTSTTKGFLPPRMTTVQRDAIANPATGLQIYNTITNTKDYFNGSAWVSTLATNSALGTPTSATLTNATGLPLSTGITGTLPIANGGTGLSTIGTNGQVLTSDGTTASWATPTGGGSGNVLVGSYNLFNAALTPSSGYLRQGTGTYNVADYPTLGAAFGTDNLTATTGAALASANQSLLGFGNGLFVTLFNSSSTYQTSTDGINWTTRTNFPVNNATLGALHYANGIWVATTTNLTTFFTSTDGINWTQITIPRTGVYYAITYNGAIWWTPSYGGSHALTSADGITWTERVLPAAKTWYVAASNTATGLIVCIAYGNDSYITSTDGLNWTQRTLPFLSWYDISFGGGLFVAIADANPNAFTTTDGINWTQQSLGISLNWRAVRYNGTYWMAIPTSPTASQVSISKNGTTWSVKVTGFSIGGNGEQPLATNGNLFVWTTTTGGTYLRGSITQATTFTVPAVTEPSGFQYWVKATTP